MDPMGAMPLDPVQPHLSPSAQDGHVLSEQYEAEREHPEPKHWQYAEYPSQDEQDSSRNSGPAHMRMQELGGGPADTWR
jgi:hypothetical protein